jgi:hypothetical protein
LTPVTAIKLKFNLSDNEFKYCFNTLYSDWKHLIMWLFRLLLIIASSAWYNLVFDEFKDINDICILIYKPWLNVINSQKELPQVNYL